ncbi:Nuclear export mediator factor NEMF-like protein [Zancudomyces culisetae]|uniref:Nuclear export mediator factor NEMF-like protein n=1 Tax=Zancudomyces culisetae TaxID=1213189 RepID=A0A1R1PCD4_ZANCU|nr:Nuclear export mediator factor NEMF-like protein [Zancudomyces culisetae]OMH83502.1 Nuclear export mediator factor NEMF-like protein [Zancudomyces culisetae]|eukprot:OMH78579.1 Nuclear export mediator factor NEMF-like protein [Zancudomyces culisetae]
MYSKRFGTFSEAVDKFYSVIEESKRTNRERAQTNVKDKKLRAIKHEQEQRIKALVELQRVSGMKAEIINENLEQTDQILTLINTLLAAEIDWEELEELVQDQKKAGHVIARDIEGLDLKKNVVKVNFTNSQETTKTVIDLDLNLSAHGNVRQYYEVKKAAAIKEEKTKRAADQAIKRATAKIYGNKKSGAVSLHNQQAILSEKKQLLRNRKIMWFEKFNWFISSDGYLVLGGKDMQQNEMLVRKYMRAHDVYVHADVHGACSVIVLNNASSSSSSSPPPLIKPSTLIQAGSMAMCYSKAWESKIITSAYWVHSNQVSKTAPTGEYLSTGSFMVRGKKNYLPPSNLVYGFGILFKLLNPISTNKSEPDVLDQQQTITSSITEGDNESVSVYDQYDELREKYNLDSVDENAQIEAQRLPSFLKQSDIASLNIPSEHPILPSTSKKNGSKSKQSSSNTDNKKQAAAAAAASKKKKEKNPKYSSKQKRGHNNDQEYDSDDVERNLIKMELLGKNKKGENKQKKSSKHSNKSSVASTLPKKTFNNSLSRNQPEKSTSDGIDTLNAESVKPLEQSQQPQSQQPKLQQQQQQQGEGQGENEELVAAVETFSNNENQEFLNSLCPNPNINPESDNNQILYAIPVMAPYSTLQLANYKYKAKLYPGNMKKGAISKTINALFTKNNKDLEELTCIRSMFEVNADLVLNTIISKSRVESNINDSGKGGKSSKGQKKSNSKKK